jgi:hypothetical protein
MGALTRRYGLVALISLVALLGAQPAVAGKPGASAHPRPQAVEPYPDDSDRPVAGKGAATPNAGVAHPNGKTPPAPKPQPSLTLGQPVNASIEIKKGSRTAYQLDANGKVIGQKKANFAANESDSASRYFRDGTIDYYLLTWGPLSGNWIRLDTTNVRVLPSTTWKELVLVFTDTNLDYVDASGTSQHLQATMTSAHRSLMVDAALRSQALAQTWSSGLVAPQMTVVDVSTPLTTLTPLGDNDGTYWLGPWDIQAALDTYAPAGAYDTVVAIWQPWDADGIVDSWGWGLSIGAGSWANGAAWSTLTVPPPEADGTDRDWWISSAEFVGEPYVHEWLHNVIDYYTNKGFAIPDLHANDQYRYTADAQGSWWRWYTDMLEQHILDPRTHRYVGINYLDWLSGTPSTRP